MRLVNVRQKLGDGAGVRRSVRCGSEETCMHGRESVGNGDESYFVFQQTTIPAYPSPRCEGSQHGLSKHDARRRGGKGGGRLSYKVNTPSNRDGDGASGLVWDVLRMPISLEQLARRSDIYQDTHRSWQRYAQAYAQTCASMAEVYTQTHTSQRHVHMHTRMSRDIYWHAPRIGTQTKAHTGY